MRRLFIGFWFFWLASLLLGCQSAAGDATVAVPTLVAPIPPFASSVATTRADDVPLTWTPPPLAERPAQEVHPTFTPRPTRTPLVLPTTTDTPLPIPTVSPTPAPTATGTPMPLPTLAADNLLPNGSFEEGWYHPGGVPELQVPDRWTFEWETGDNPLDPDPWNDWVRPEVRVLPSEALPASEHELFIWSGNQTVKVFKGSGAVSFRLTTDITLPPGRYVLIVRVFPDLVVGYTASGAKRWAPDPLSGEVRLIAADAPTTWQLPLFGQRNTYSQAFTVAETQTVRVGVALRGRWAIENNGWFLDDWALYRTGDAG